MTTPSRHELGTGRYRVTLTANGSGRSTWDWIALNRWPADAVEDAHGFFIYLRDLDSGALWSAGLQPVPDETVIRANAGLQTSGLALDARLRGHDAQANAHFRCERTADEVLYVRCMHGIDSRMGVRVDAQDDVEIRWLSLSNPSGRTRRIEITSCIEIALAHPQADLNHPCFLKLFVQTASDPARGLLTATRRPRGSDERWPTIFHALTGASAEAWETDRARFIGRGRSVAHPAMDMRGTVGNVLDPLFALRTQLTLAPGETRELGFLLGIADDAEAAARRAAGHGAQPFAHTPEPARRPAPPLTHGFTADGREYRIELPWLGDAPARPPMPWINVIANERFGTLASEAGAGCTWSRNSQQNRLTPWSADPVCDPHDEAFYLRDLDTGQFWSALPGPTPAPVAYEAVHGFGYSRYHCTAHGIAQTTTVFVARHDPVKFVRLQLRNEGADVRSLAVVGYQRLVLGTLPDGQRPVRSWVNGQALCARCELPGDFADGIAFAAAVGGDAAGHGCDRRSFIGPNRSSRNPAAVERDALDGRSGDNLDPCFALRRTITLAPGATAIVTFMLGEATSADELERLIARHATQQRIDAALDEVRQFWRDSLDGLRVATPSPEIDAMVNGWLPYQALACRLWARSAYYQSSGAYGFRDQLQDAGNFSLLWPQRTRAQILLHAQRQFVEGDVLHWWHDAPVIRGVRTRFADDLLWLPYVTDRYVRDTGDATIYDEPLPFLQGPQLAPDQEENYLQPAFTDASATLYEHCCRAIDRSLTRGAHGLPLMGTGDWNDGMNRIGREGRGESVWLGFFLYDLLAPFIALAQQRGDAARATRYATYRTALHDALNDAGWDGAWYRRAYFDDGAPLGTKENPECRIDGLAQAWAVLSGAAPPGRAVQAMQAAAAQLVDEDHGLIRLLTPPFVDLPHDPGYIKGYVAGVRENGGQYTHAACWVVAAAAQLGWRARAARWLAMLGPAWHTRDAQALDRYQVEPYVIAADIYGADPHVGRGGWTWYTGSAGWAWRVAVESVLGLRVIDGRRLRLAPCVPDEWAGYRIDYQPPGLSSRYAIEVENPQRCSAAVIAATLDGAPLTPRAGAVAIDLADDGARHRLVVTLGPAPA
ncbi:glycosyl transferase [Fontimonas sp. SYSU GA230001]|uniref:GH36-type glycosyl hydrolase domain-containing protein n=1 Tax=Fontimonas sp. SYSU GA230001 TaxID=3142450 RepID=UPI0032B4E297